MDASDPAQSAALSATVGATPSSSSTDPWRAPEEDPMAHERTDPSGYPESTWSDPLGAAPRWSPSPEVAFSKPWDVAPGSSPQVIPWAGTSAASDATVVEDQSEGREANAGKPDSPSDPWGKSTAESADLWGKPSTAESADPWGNPCKEPRSTVCFPNAENSDTVAIGADGQITEAQANPFGWGELANLNLKMDKMPAYLRAHETVYKDPHLKAVLIDCPLTSMRKCGQVMDVEFVRIRKSKEDQRKEQIRQKRFQRRCTPRLRPAVLDKWEKKYTYCPELLPDISSQPAKDTTLSKDFFAKLRNK